MLLSSLLVAGVMLPLVVGAIAGSLDVPRNDDWAYRRLALEFERTGALPHNVMAMIFGQVVITQPLLWLSDADDWAFGAAGILFAVSGVVSAYALARQFLHPPKATIAAALLLLFPGYLGYATSYMSDVPALTAQFACLTLGAVALRRRPVSGGWLIASIAVGSFGFSIRDFALAAPVAVVLSAICIDPRRWLHWALAVTAAVGFYSLYALRAELTPFDLGASPSSAGAGQQLQALGVVALVVCPAAIVGAVHWRHLWRRFDVAVGAEIGLILLVRWLLQWRADETLPSVILPNLASRWGSPQREMFLGDRPLLFGDVWWVMVSGATLLATVVVLGSGSGIVGAYVRRLPRSARALRDRLGSPMGLLWLFTLLTSVGLAVYGVFYPVLDRYYWPLITPIAVLLMYVPRRYVLSLPTPARSIGVGLAALVMASFSVLVAMTMVLMLNANAFDAARWRAGERLADTGIPRDEIDAGYEWVGLHATTPLLGGGSHQVFYRRFWPMFQECGFVVSEREDSPAAELIAVESYSRYLIAGPEERLYLYRRTGPECGPP